MMNLVIHESPEALKAELNQYLTQGSALHFIVPSPQEADAVRRFWLDKTSNRSQISVDTIHSFMTETSKMKDSFKAEQYKKKSDIISHLVKYFLLFDGPKEWTHFLAAYEVFSNIRSFTLDPVVLEELLQFYPEDISIPAQIFFKGILTEGIADEHQWVSDLSFWIKNGEIELGLESDIYIFSGFKYLNGHQLDLLKSIGHRRQLIVPVGQKLYDARKSQDWISWLIENQTETKVLTEEKIKKTEINIFRYSSNQKQDLYQHWKTQNPELVQVLHLCRDLCEKNYFEFSEEGIFYRQKISIFKEMMNFYKEQVASSLVLSSRHFLDDYVLWCDTEVQKAKIQFKDDFPIRYKILMDLKDIIQKINFKPQIEVSSFLIDATFSILELNLPRLYSFPLMKEKSLTKVLSWREKQETNPHFPVLYVVDEEAAFFNSLEKIYPKGLIDRLFSIGPVPRAEWDFIFDYSEFCHLVIKNGNYLALPEGIENHRLEWKRVLSELSYQEKNIPQVQDKIINWGYHIKEGSRKLNENKVSASRIQEYINCPQSFYFKYIDKLFPEVISQNELTPMELGIVEHLILQKCYNLNQNFKLSQEMHKNVVYDCYLEFVTNKKLVLHSIEQKKYIIELETFTQNALSVLQTIDETNPGIKWEFEKKIEWANGSGFIDLYGVKDQYKYILDFKRTDSQVPSFSKWKSFDKIQILFYLSRLIQENLIQTSDQVFMGYIPMASVEKIWFAGSMTLPENFPYKYHQENFLIDLLPTYKEFEDDTVERFLKETEFNPDPKSPDVCMYCPLVPICPGASVKDDV